MPKRRHKSADRQGVSADAENRTREAPEDDRMAEGRDLAAASLYLDQADPPKKRPWLLLTAGLLLAAWNIFLLILALTASS